MFVQRIVLSRWYVVALLAISVSAVAIQFGPVAGAVHPTWSCGFYTDTPIRWTSSSGYATPIANAVNAWDSATDANFAIATPYNLRFIDVDNVGGFAARTVPDACPNRKTVEMNTRILSGYSATQRQSTAAHEVGHALGRNHPASDNCSINTILYSTIFRLITCNWLNPQSHDITSVNGNY